MADVNAAMAEFSVNLMHLADACGRASYSIGEAGAELYIGGSFSGAWSEAYELTSADACPYCGVTSEYRADWPWCCGCGAPLA